MNTQWMEQINFTYCYLALAAGLLLAWWAWTAGKRSREGRSRAFQRRLETVLLPREKVKVLCPQGKIHHILTSKRLLTETREGFTALDLKDIKSAQGFTAEGKRTTVPAKMAELTIKAGQELHLKNTGPEFEELAKQLGAVLKKRKKK